MPEKVPAKDLKADIEKVIPAAEFMYERFLEYAAEHTLSLLDVFMVAHNVHKRIVINVAIQSMADGENPEHTFREADMTWRMAMREVKRAYNIAQTRAAAT
jgi:hypothetical protein